MPKCLFTLNRRRYDQTTEINGPFIQKHLESAVKMKNPFKTYSWIFCLPEHHDYWKILPISKQSLYKSLQNVSLDLVCFVDRILRQKMIEHPDCLFLISFKSFNTANIRLVILKQDQILVGRKYVALEPCSELLPTVRDVCTTDPGTLLSNF